MSNTIPIKRQQFESGLESKKLLFLGTGTSSGVPVITCQCPVCTSDDPKNNRTRTSALLSFRDKRILIDPSIDFRQQALRNKINHIDAVLITHPHADHIFGLDELRIYSARYNRAIPIYASPETLESIKVTFRYVFSPPQEGGGVPNINLIAVEDTFLAEGFSFTPIPLKHGILDIMGYRHNDFAYLTDCSEIPESSWPLLQGIKILVLDALRYRPHSTHFNIEQALKVVEILKPESTYFVHMCHDIEHTTCNEQLPPGVQLAYDGLEIQL